MCNILDEMYKVSRAEREAFLAFGDWRGPEAYVPLTETLVSHRDRDIEDGLSVDIYCVAFPARAYSIQVQPQPDSLGRMKPGFRIGFGTMSVLKVLEIARMLLEGMMGIGPNFLIDPPEQSIGESLVGEEADGKVVSKRPTYCGVLTKDRSCEACGVAFADVAPGHCYFVEGDDALKRVRDHKTAMNPNWENEGKQP